MEKFKSNNYDFVSPFYDVLASIYSCGLIRQCKTFQTQFIREGDSVLFVGAGTADDAILAAKKGAHA